MAHARVPHRSNRSSKNALVNQLVRHNLRAVLNGASDTCTSNPCVPCQTMP